MSQNESREENIDFILKILLDECEESLSGKPELSSFTLKEKIALMRALENIRYPYEATPYFIEAESKELSYQLEEKGGVVDMSELDEGDIVIWKGDITTLRVDAIVNACNDGLLGCWVPGHLCIDNAIHSAAGVRLRIACNDIMKGQLEETGKARITPGFCLPCKYVLHTVGPIIEKGYDPTEDEEDLLASCYISCLQCAEENKLESVAFCCISTGEFHFPNKRAAEIAVNTVKSFMAGNPTYVKKVIFNTFKDVDDDIYHDLLEPK